MSSSTDDIHADLTELCRSGYIPFGWREWGGIEEDSM
jgi:hypothetical protein